MSLPVSRRYLPRRELLITTLRESPVFALMTHCRDLMTFANLASELFPAFAVFYADNSNDLELHIAMRSDANWLELEDCLHGYVEAAEDILAAVPTLGGIVKGLEVKLLERTRREIPGCSELHHFEVVLALRFELNE